MLWQFIPIPNAVVAMIKRILRSVGMNTLITASRFSDRDTRVYNSTTRNSSKSVYPGGSVNASFILQRMVAYKLQVKIISTEQYRFLEIYPILWELF